MGKVVKRVKIWKVLLLEVFLLVAFITKLCLYIVECQGEAQLGSFFPSNNWEVPPRLRLVSLKRKMKVAIFVLGE